MNKMDKPIFVSNKNKQNFQDKTFPKTVCNRPIMIYIEFAFLLPISVRGADGRVK